MIMFTLLSFDIEYNEQFYYNTIIHNLLMQLLKRYIKQQNLTRIADV